MSDNVRVKLNNVRLSFPALFKKAVFEGKEGFMDCFGPDWDNEKLLGSLGEKFKILECSMKAFPTEALTHTHISAALKVAREHEISFGDYMPSLTMAVNDTLKVSLPNLKSQGWKWYIVYYNVNAMELVSQGEVANKANASLGGGAYLDVYLFKATKPAEFTMQIDHQRVEGQHPDKIFELDVIIK